jgi:hypothetical protein
MTGEQISAHREEQAALLEQNLDQYKRAGGGWARAEAWYTRHIKRAELASRVSNSVGSNAWPARVGMVEERASMGPESQPAAGREPIAPVNHSRGGVQPHFSAKRRSFSLTSRSTSPGPSLDIVSPFGRLHTRTDSIWRTGTPATFSLSRKSSSS